MKRIPVIDLVRTASILLVVGLHVCDTKLLPQGPVSFSLTQFSVNFSNGAYGVTLFFLVSGYLITGLLLSGRIENPSVDLRDFYVKRFARIFPLLALVVGVGAAAVAFPLCDSWIYQDIFRRPGFHYDFRFWASFPTFLFNWLLVVRTNLHHSSPGAYWIILWSLSIEEQFYLVYPWVLKRLRGFRGILLFLGLVVAGAVLYRCLLSLLGLENAFYTVVTSFGSFDAIALGCLLYFVSAKWGSYFRENKRESALVCALGFFLAVAAYVNFSAVFPTPFNCGNICGPFLVALGGFLFLLGGLHLEFFEHRAWSWVTVPGKLSYGCYLWHFFVIFLLWPWLQGMGAVPSFLLTVVAVTAAAYVSYLFIEAPANRMIRKAFGTEASRSLSLPTGR